MAVGGDLAPIDFHRRGYLWRGSGKNNIDALMANWRVQTTHDARVELLDRKGVKHRFPSMRVDKLVGKLEQLRSGPPRTFHDYKVVDPFTQEQAEPVAELPSHGPADEGMPVPHVDLEDETPLASPSERTVDEAPLFAGDKRLTKRAIHADAAKYG